MIRKFLALSLTCCLVAAPAFSKDKFQTVAPVHLDKDGEKWADKTLKAGEIKLDRSR